MNCNLSCTYNKRNKIFDWNNIDKEVTDVDELFRELISYTKLESNSKTVSTGYDACYKYIGYLKNNLINDIELKKQDFKVFWDFKSNVKKLIENVFANNYVVTSPSLCNDYFKTFNKCKTLYNSVKIDYKSLLQSIELLHIQEKDIIGKVYGLRIIKYAK